MTPPSSARTSARLSLLMAAAAGCSDYSFTGKEEPKGGGEEQPTDSGGDTSAPPDTDAPPPPDEECDGIDNNGDGRVDEGWPDIDGDGVADCTDEECGLDRPTLRSEAAEDCAGSTSTSTPPADPWSTVVEWQFTGGAVYSTPAVGDLDQDGAPEVVFTHAGAGSPLRVVDGRTGALRWELPGVDNQSGVALGDIDGDGLGDIIATTGSCYTAHDVLAVDHTGAIKWRVAGSPAACETYPVLVDLTGDGTVEVIVNEHVFEGATGRLLLTLPVGADNWGAPAAVDMDGDGLSEIMLGNDLFSHDGGLRFTCGVADVGGFPHPVNADADPEGEMLVAGNGSMTLCDDDGRELWRRPYSSYGAPLAIADFDDDGVQEYAFAKTSSLTLIQPDNTTLWSTPVIDYSGLAGATSWDIDLDGVPEVVYADEEDILVFDGATGAVVLRFGSHGSVTLAETPAVADVDGDGQGELLYGSNTSLTGLTVIGGAGGDWPFAPTVYNQYSYYGDNINEDLSVPPGGPAPWLSEANLFRGQPSAVFFEAGLPNLRVEITDVCAASCAEDGAVGVAGQAWNDGGVELPAGVVVELWGFVGGVETFLARAVLPDPIPAGGAVALELEVTVAQAREGLRLQGDLAGAVAECKEDDNAGDWSGALCP
ncbi:MAG: hypothetical protein JNM72_25350 [Deltaproteobacteria bacterium]|nr:hypothetical protein [Deltaproteobacteria bacterium]